MGAIKDHFQSRDLILISRPRVVFMIKKKKVLCAIFGCGTRSGRDKGIKRTSVQKSNKNEIFMARVKNSNCLNFCTQVDPSKTRKAVYFFSSNVF